MSPPTPVPMGPPSRFRPAAKLSLAIGVCLSAWIAPGLGAQARSAEPSTEQPASPPLAAENLDASHFETLRWRHLGPANPTGRITDIEVHPEHPSTWYVGTAGGGLWKTVNRGTTWSVSFDDQSTVSIGDVAVAPSNPDIVWVGSGEENGRNSVSWGDGVYRSTDGGKTFSHMGLEETFQIGHIAIHPTDPDTVYVAALGRLWGHNPDRGVFRTRDGGATWQKVLYIDDKTGAIDVRIDPEDPDTLWACVYERLRDGFDGNDPSVRFGERSGFYKSTDGGDSWRQITEGLPSCKWGRSGLTVHAGDPHVLYVIIETERSGWATGDRQQAVQPRGNANSRRALMGIRGTPGRGGGGNDGATLASVTRGGAAAEAGLEAGDVIVKMDDEVVSNYDDLVEQIREHQAGDTVEITYRRDDEEKTCELTFQARTNPAGGARQLAAFPNGGRLGGQNANVGNQGENGHETGGVFRSDDHGETWKRVNSLTERPFYYSVIQVAPSDPDRIYSCGVQFWTSDDGGARFENITNGIHVDFHAIWVHPTEPETVVACCDGGVNISYDAGETWEVNKGISAAQFYKVTADNRVPYHVWGGLQDNGTWGGPSRSAYREGITLHDWSYIYSGDGFGAVVDPVEHDLVYATSQNGNIGLVDLATGGTSRVNRPRGLRWNWDSPFVLSPHNRMVLYLAGSQACRAVRKGRSLEAVALSPELGLTERGTATVIAESPRVEGLLYVGTDDGALWRSQDDGATWEEIHGKVLGMPGPRYVSHVEPSHHDDDRVYVTFEGHRSDDRSTYVFVSRDRGDTWTSLADDLPSMQPVHVLREDPQNEDLLFVGTEFSCFASLDRGAHWFGLTGGLPTVAVRDLFIQDRDSDLVTGTHGRGIWTIDIEPLRQLAGNDLGKAQLLAPEDVILWRERSRVLLGDHDFRAANPSRGLTAYAWLGQTPDDEPSVKVHDLLGNEIASIDGEPRAGLHRFSWSGQPSRGGRRGSPARPGLSPGSFSVRMGEGEGAQAHAFRVHPDPSGGARATAAPLATPSRNPR